MIYRRLQQSFQKNRLRWIYFLPMLLEYKYLQNFQS
jgi:hypothetical protein